MTSDLQNLSLHSDSTGHNDIMIGDGTGLPITHTGFSTLQSFPCYPNFHKFYAEIIIFENNFGYIKQINGSTKIMVIFLP